MKASGVERIQLCLTSVVVVGVVVGGAAVVVVVGVVVGVGVVVVVVADM